MMAKWLFSAPKSPAAQPPRPRALALGALGSILLDAPLRKPKWRSQDAVLAVDAPQLLPIPENVPQGQSVGWRLPSPEAFPAALPDQSYDEKDSLLVREGRKR